jgi:hypothetical protein
MGPRKRADSPKAPEPYVLRPSGVFDGNDGRWSSFYINIGDDEQGRGQNFKVLVSTSIPGIYVPNQAGWCSPDCAADRGVQIFEGSQSMGFDSSKSHAWRLSGLFVVPVPAWWTEDKFNATYGFDNVGLGESSTSSYMLQEQTVGRYESQELFMGSFGLSQTVINTGSGPQEPFLNTFAYFNIIPSKSYGYGAGAWYRKCISPGQRGYGKY